mmetsp:Transcript_135926/g.330416  ORF Transcript_135926/g.330416 Transcript_135926/m.330416 type:complete len:301 (+) Transcript_135926:467-1369(+)
MAAMAQRHRLNGLVAQVVKPIDGYVPAPSCSVGLVLQRALRERHTLAAGIKHQGAAPLAVAGPGAEDLDVLRRVTLERATWWGLLKARLGSPRTQLPSAVRRGAASVRDGSCRQLRSVHAKVICHDEALSLGIATQPPRLEAATVRPDCLQGTALNKLGKPYVRHLQVARAHLHSALGELRGDGDGPSSLAAEHLLVHQWQGLRMDVGVAAEPPNAPQCACKVDASQQPGQRSEDGPRRRLAFPAVRGASILVLAVCVFAGRPVALRLEGAAVRPRHGAGGAHAFKQIIFGVLELDPGPR